MNNGVYKCGFATSQSAYDAASDALFSEFHRLNTQLSDSRFLLGDKCELSSSKTGVRSVSVESLNAMCVFFPPSYDSIPSTAPSSTAPVAVCTPFPTFVAGCVNSITCEFHHRLCRSPRHSTLLTRVGVTVNCFRSIRVGSYTMVHHPRSI